MEHVALRLVRLAKLLLVARRPQPVDAKVLVSKIQSLLLSMTKNRNAYKSNLRSMGVDLGKPETHYITFNDWWKEVQEYIKNVVKYRADAIEIDTPKGSDRRISPRTMLEFHKKLAILAPKYGWFIVEEHLPGLEDVNWRTPRVVGGYYVTLARQLDERLTQVPKYLYHITPEENVDRIFKRGLIPKKSRYDNAEGDPGGSISRKYPPRIYLLLKEAGISELAFGFAHSDDPDAYAHGKHDGPSYAALKIDTSKLSKGTKFYYDPEFKGDSVYTYTQVPPQAISKYKRTKS